MIARHREALTVRRAMVLAALLTISAAPVRADYFDHFAIRADIGVHKVPHLGDARLLLIPVEVKGFPPLDETRLRAFFSDDFAGGFVDFYTTASLGRYRPRVTVAPKVVYETCPLPPDKFPTCTIKRSEVSALVSGIDLLRQSIARANEAGVDFSAFDSNGGKGEPDGWVDGVMLLANIEVSGIAFPIGYLNQGDDLDGGTGGPLVVDGVRIATVAVAGRANEYVMVHEFGHLLGLTDLYDESNTYDGLHLSFMGSWRYDSPIPLPDAETRFRLQWGEWHQVQGRQRVRIRPAETSGDVYRLGTGDEYFLVENRGPGKFDGSLDARGLAVFHVDRTVKLSGEEGAFVHRLLDCVNCNPWHPLIRLVQADGSFDLERDGRFSAADDLFTENDGLFPDESGIPLSAAHAVNSTNFYSGTSSGFRLEDVDVQDDGSIDVTLVAPETSQCSERLCASGESCTPSTCGAPPPKAQPGCASTPGAELAGFLALLGVLAQLARRRS
jgi:M6 family metalloprotease-like protein